MGYREISLKLPTDYHDSQLRQSIAKALRIKEFSYLIDNKSLDARKKNDIHWLIQVAVSSREIKGGTPPERPSLTIPYKKRNEKAVVVGSGPAGFFAAFVLQKAGFCTTLIERGSEVDQRSREIDAFEHTGVFNPVSNYAFGEGGAGTFSDGKLTSRSKHISLEKEFILASYVRAGAPEEILYMAHPHLGSDNLKKIVRNLREEFIKIGGKILFETFLQDLKINDGKITEAVTPAGDIAADFFVIASGHSAHETYRMLIRRGVPFRTKNFAIGSRVEHPQEIINLAQWGQKKMAGVKAAEYRLTSNPENHLPVYTFCMCPGGVVVPASAYDKTNIVNGMSLYNRDGRFANAACVAGVHPDRLLGKQATPLEALDWLGALEENFYLFAQGFHAPFCTIPNFISGIESSENVESSYPLGLKPAPLWDLLPGDVTNAIRRGLQDFCRKVKGFETGIILGLESKTSSPIQVVRDESGLCPGFVNLYMVGEGSGYSGGIISSGADGIIAAMKIQEIA
ncbi:MAG: FAD-dependent monooxygenase [Candidatus Riflebacteria bacterium]|nr:FAD-dependent monooxygenase [Candidatus Riflebacteria bacterium]